MNSSMPLPGPPRTADPQQIHADVDELLELVDRLGSFGAPDDEDRSVSAEDGHAAGEPMLGRMAGLLEQAHDVLVAGLSTVDKA
ncbi:hypothetical protein G4X40_22345 [Rhodococcus sp. D2-41]|uniref:hypothetical protein n=1 Tax=Speluncibacter jeojiensis TaxID=2710754 RepID=UPI0024107C5A|nr:hypothetical protein [Rhodococcus sp. D2-41]MDG3012884.1 hypothetical protein [Rhodococcus sp. D2-41]